MKTKDFEQVMHEIFEEIKNYSANEAIELIKQLKTK